jgi:hypothetical protein
MAGAFSTNVDNRRRQYLSNRAFDLSDQVPDNVSRRSKRRLLSRQLAGVCEEVSGPVTDQSPQQVVHALLRRALKSRWPPAEATH